MLLAAYNLARFDHVSQLLNFRVFVPTKCRCCCAQVNDAEFNLLAVKPDETTVRRDVVSSCGVRPCSISYRDALFLIRNARAPKLEVPSKIVDVRNYSRFNLEGFQFDVKTIPMEYIKLVSKDASEVA